MKRIFLFLVLSILIGCHLGAQEADLRYFIDKALENSPLIKDIGNRQRSVLIDSMRILAGFGPQINGISNNYYAPVIKGWGYDEVVTDKANVSVQVSLTKDFVSRLNRENQFRALQLENISLLNGRKISEQELIREVSSQYVLTYGNYQDLRFNQEVLLLLNKEEIILKRLTEDNIYRQTDYLTFLLTVQQQEYKLALSKSRYVSNLAMLNHICGIYDTTTLFLSDPKLSVAILPELKNTIFFKSFINDSLRLVIEDRQIDYSYRPKLSLFTDAGYFSSLYFQPWKNFGASAGINLSVPIYDGNQKKMQHDRILISQQTRQAYQTFYSKQYNQVISGLFSQLEDNTVLSEMLNKQLVYTMALIDANHKLLETGDLLVADYIIAINNYLSVKNESVQNLIERYQLINQINYWNRTK